MSRLERLAGIQEPMPPGNQISIPPSIAISTTAMSANGIASERRKATAALIREGKLALAIIPYQASADKNSSVFLPGLWRQLKDEGLIELYYPGYGETSFSVFVNLFNDPGINKIIFLLVDPAIDRNDPAWAIDCIGFATLGVTNLLGSMAATAGFIFRKEFWDRTTTIAAANLGLEYWFHEMPEPRPPIILGLNPSGNVLVQAFLRKIGWTRDCQLPIPQFYDGKHSDLVVWHITAEQFDALNAINSKVSGTAAEEPTT